MLLSTVHKQLTSGLREESIRFLSKIRFDLEKIGISEAPRLHGWKADLVIVILPSLFVWCYHWLHFHSLL